MVQGHEMCYLRLGAGTKLSIAAKTVEAEQMHDQNWGWSDIGQNCTAPGLQAIGCTAMSLGTLP